MYDRDRFFCITGDLLSNVKTLKDCTETIAQINKDFIGVRPEPIIILKRETDWFPSDNELVDKIRTSKKGDRFNELFNGFLVRFISHSSADFALCTLLAWWTQDASQIDRIFRCSGLYRPRWDSRRGNSTYGSNVIQNALQVQSGRYEPRIMLKVIYKTPAEM